MTSLPPHYRKLFASFIRLACWMIFFGLVAGILFQESSRKTPYEKFAPGLHWEAVYHLALLHGHVFLIGVVIPLVVLLLLYFALLLGSQPLSEKSVRWGKLLYHSGAGLTVVLMLYKGYHYLISVRMGQLDFAAIDHGFFGGQHVLRAIVYGLGHTAMAVGLGVFAWGILKSLPKGQPAPEV